MTDELRRLVNTSGYPFQLRLEHEVRRTRDQHHWDVVTAEYPWISERHGQQGFADLVLEAGSMRAVIECKRLQEHGRYVFLCPTGARPQRRVVFYWSDSSERNVPPRAGWSEIGADPPAPESGFCVVQGTGPKDRPLLERVGAELTSAVEAIAADSEHAYRAGTAPERGLLWVYIPLIVTNAELVVCTYMPDQVSIETGRLDEATFTTVQFVRFRKGLSVLGPPERSDGQPTPQRPISLKEYAPTKDRTVLIVHASALTEVLGKLAVGRLGHRSLPWDVS